MVTAWTPQEVPVATWGVENDGDVDGPASSTDNAIARFNGTTGKIIQDSGVLIDDSDNITGVNDLTIGGTFSDGTLSIVGGDISSVGTITATTFTDGTATLTGGALSGLTTLATPTAITMAEDGWIGIGASSERIVFDGSLNRVQAYDCALECRWDQDAITRIIINNDNVNASAATRLSFYDDTTERAYIQYANDGSGDMTIYNAGDDIVLSPAGSVAIPATTRLEFRDDALYISSPADSIMALEADGYVRVGTGTTSRSLSGNGSFLVSGNLEVDGAGLFEDALAMYAYSVSGVTRTRLMFINSTADRNSDLGADETYDQLLWTLDIAHGRQLILGETGFHGTDFDHAIQTNPTLFVHSATDPDSDNTEWISGTHNQTDGVIGCGKGDIIITCPSEKTLELSQVVWKDENLDSGRVQLPASSAPSIDTFTDENGADTDIATLAFSDGDKVGGTIELQHDYKEGSDFTFHIHFQNDAAPSGTDYVAWEIDYTVVRDGTTMDAVTNISTGDIAVDTQYEQVRANWTAVTGTGFQIGDQLSFKLARVTASGDAYAGDCKIKTVGIHYQVDTIGSRQISTK